MVTSFDISQEIFSIDTLTAFKSSLKHRRTELLRSFQLYGDQALVKIFTTFQIGKHVQDVPKNSPESGAQKTRFS